MVQQVMGNLLSSVQQFILENGRLVKKVSCTYKWCEIYVILLKAKGNMYYCLDAFYFKIIIFFWRGVGVLHILYYTEQGAHCLSNLPI
jgi:hypothetical protein